MELAKIKEERKDEERRGGPSGGAPTASVAPPTSRGPTFNRVMGGYDWAEYGLAGTWASGEWETLQPILKAAKTAAADGDIPGSIIDLDGRQWQVSAKSATGFVTFSYILQSAGTVLMLHAKPEKVPQPIRVRLGAVALSGNDLFAVVQAEREYLKRLGFRETGHLISRVDAQVMTEREVTDYTAKIETGCVVCKATGDSATHARPGKLPHSYRIGSDISLRIYDKGRELDGMMESDPLKYRIMVEYCLGEDWLYENKPLTRIEFQLRREALHDLKIDTFDDLLRSERSLFQLLANRWFRLTEEPKKRGHSSTQETADIWLEVQKSFERWFPGADENRDAKINRGGPPKCDPSHYLKQAVGLVGDVRDSLSYIFEKLGENAEKFYNRTVERAREFGVQVGKKIERFEEPWNCFDAESAHAAARAWLDSLTPGPGIPVYNDDF